MQNHLQALIVRLPLCPVSPEEVAETNQVTYQVTSWIRGGSQAILSGIR